MLSVHSYSVTEFLLVCTCFSYVFAIVYIYIDLNKRDLKKLTKTQLIKLLLKQEKDGQAQKPSDIVNEYEDIIQPPEQFRDAYKPIPAPRTKIRKPYLNHKRMSNKWLMSTKTSHYHHPNSLGMDTSQFQNEGLTDHFKCKMHEDRQNL